MKNITPKLKAAMEALSRASESIYEEPDFDEEYSYYKEVLYLIEEALDAIRGANALV